MSKQRPHIAKAFLSCSLRPEDKPFIDFVERILACHRILPIGTIGKYSVAPMNLAEHMKINIPLADFMVIVATPRYLQKDLQTGQTSYGLSEMIHVETGMAYMANKPVIVFAKEGSNIGGFLPNVTEYVILNGYQTDLENKWQLINNLLSNAYAIVKKIQDNQSSKEIGEMAKVGLAILGAFTLADSLLSESKPLQKKRLPKRKR